MSAPFGYYASFDTLDPRNGFGTVTFERDGFDPFEINIAGDLTFFTASGSDGLAVTGVYNHFALGAAFSEDADHTQQLAASVAFRSLAEQVSVAMVQAAQVESWPDFADLLCTFDDTSLRYTFSYNGSGTTFTAITFENAATRALFGFASDFTGDSASETGTLLPDFIILPELSCTSVDGSDGFDYEPSGIGMSSLSPAGHKVGITRSSVPRYRDWFQQSEPRAKVHRLSAATSHPMTHERLFELSRCAHPFVVFEGFGANITNVVCRLRPDGCMWNSTTCKRAGGDAEDGLFDVRYQTQILGSL